MSLGPSTVFDTDHNLLQKILEKEIGIQEQFYHGSIASSLEEHKESDLEK